MSVQIFELPIVKSDHWPALQAMWLRQPVLPDNNSEREPPDPFSNSEVKPLSADGSVGPPHVRVGHCQASK